MLNVSKSISVTGSSTIMVDGVSTTVMTMSANISESDSISVNKFIQDGALYSAHKTEVKKDFNDFEDYVDSLVDSDEA